MKVQAKGQAKSDQPLSSFDFIVTVVCRVRIDLFCLIDNVQGRENEGPVGIHPEGSGGI